MVASRDTVVDKIAVTVTETVARRATNTIVDKAAATVGDTVTDTVAIRNLRT